MLSLNRDDKNYYTDQYYGAVHNFRYTLTLCAASYTSLDTYILYLHRSSSDPQDGWDKLLSIHSYLIRYAPICNLISKESAAIYYYEGEYIAFRYIRTRRYIYE